MPFLLIEIMDQDYRWFLKTFTVIKNRRVIASMGPKIIVTIRCSSKTNNHVKLDQGIRNVWWRTFTHHQSALDLLCPSLTFATCCWGNCCKFYFYSYVKNIYWKLMEHSSMSQCNILDCAAADKTKMDSMRHRKCYFFAETSLLLVRGEQYDSTNWIMIWFLWQYTFLMTTSCHDSVKMARIKNISYNFFESFLFIVCLWNTIYFPITSTVQVKFRAQTCFPLFQWRKGFITYFFYTY